jgi:magnesium-transporting ATPase (P-type)
VPFDLGHFVDRFFQPFNTESRFWWPAIYAVGISLVANIVWYNWRRRGAAPPAENALKQWAFWTNIVFLIVIMVCLIAKLPFFFLGIVIAANIAALGFMYLNVLPPQEAAWEREQRRQRYFPQPERRKKKRRR